VVEGSRHLSSFEPETGTESFDDQVGVPYFIVSPETTFCLEDLYQRVFLAFQQGFGIPYSECLSQSFPGHCHCIEGKLCGCYAFLVASFNRQLLDS